MHEQRGIKPLKALCARLKIPAEHQQLAEAVCREHLNVHRIDELRDATVLELLGRCDALRRPERVARIALCCEADKRGRLGFEDADYPQGETLKRLHQAALSVRQGSGYHASEGPAIGEALAKARVKAIAAAR
jgi:tRNA nucleotidyltransferase (CCA-adding enzyme)